MRLLLLGLVLCAGCAREEKPHRVFRYTAHIYVENVSVAVTAESENEAQAALMLGSAVDMALTEPVREKIRRASNPSR